MTSGRFRFDRFVLDPENRTLTHDGAAVDLSARYLDALALLVREHGRLVSKDRFHVEVWRGVPVTDEALTQCVRTLRRALGDSASTPRFIETVPKHGYRFIAGVEDFSPLDSNAPEVASSPTDAWRRFLRIGIAGVVGAGVAGTLVGLLYGLVGIYAPGAGDISSFLVIICVCIVAALIGGVGASFGAAAAVFTGRRRWAWGIAGGAIGGLVIGALAKMVGLDAFDLLFGRSPGDITGAAEGALFGAAVGAATWWNSGDRQARAATLAGVFGGGAGALVVALGGRLMGGSLDLLAQQFPASHLRLDRLGVLFGEAGYGPLAESITGAIEGALFSACVTAAMVTARRAPDA